MLTHTSYHLNKPERFRLLILSTSFKINSNSEGRTAYCRECVALLHFGLILFNLIVLWVFFFFESGDRVRSGQRT